MKSAKPNNLLNLSINLAAIFLFLMCLYVVSHSESIPVILGCIFLFSYVANTIFALLHESVHRVYSHTEWLNEIMGIINGALFPTGLTFQRVCHLGHHLRNRTDHEMFDMYYEEDNLFLKRAQFYSILTGIYWLTIPIGWLTYLICPWSYRLLKTDNVAIKHTGAIMLHPFIDHPKKWRIRFELLFVIALQVAIYLLLDLKFLQTLACFWVFGLFWGSLQYADHAWSPRDILKGAWNLKVNPITRWFFLNYHYHQVHHMNPKLPWNHLPKHVDPHEPQPSFLKIYFEMWKGPRPAQAPNPILKEDIKNELSSDEDLRVEKQESCEWNCFKQFIQFSLRNKRYASIAFILYSFSFKNWKMAKRLRHGFCALQVVDDLLDGDRKCQGEPLEVVAKVLQCLETNDWGQSDLHQLFKVYLSQLKSSPDYLEGVEILKVVIEAMMFDRSRVVNKLELNYDQLIAQHRKTFSTSLDILLISMGSSLRTKDAPSILDVFAWCSMYRDLEEDLDKGLVNIPVEVFGEHWPNKSPDKSWARNSKVQEWLKSENIKVQDYSLKAKAELNALIDEPGKKVFLIFVRSMDKYIKKAMSAI
ncbi:MAG: fatty acid desaturase [Bacteriovoracaceae bacterium]|nr:fatty acid desaturase [Bacteriovoracaceae bacterium]